MSAENLFNGKEAIQVRVLACSKETLGTWEAPQKWDHPVHTFYAKDYGNGSIVSAGDIGIHHGGLGYAQPSSITEENGVWAATFCYEYRPVRDFGASRDIYRKVTFMLETA